MTSQIESHTVVAAQPGEVIMKNEVAALEYLADSGPQQAA
jgi:hypothetical protein